MARYTFIFSFVRIFLVAILLGGLLLCLIRPAVAATQIDIYGPAGSGEFGHSFTVLPTVNIVVSDPGYDGVNGVDEGAVYLYNGITGALISTLTGSHAGDQVGSGEVTVLDNGNYVVSSPAWNNGIGAVTWGNGASGISGQVSSANSLVGSTAGDGVGSIDLLDNGNYVVSNPAWDNGAVIDAGAVTWGDATNGVIGVISEANSLVGSTAGDQVGFEVTPLSNGGYVVSSPYWDNETISDAGAVTWGSGTSGIKGIISLGNSLVGSTTNDYLGMINSIYKLAGVTALTNGNYVVNSPYWDNGVSVDAGAATWGSGMNGVKGVITSSNSLVGSTAGDWYWAAGVYPLPNGNYLVLIPWWDNGTEVDAGAVTWADGTTGVSGEISASNSLIGSHAGDSIGLRGNGRLVLLNNGNFVVSSPAWNKVGAVTWISSANGITGVVSDENSLVGSTDGGGVGYYVIPLDNGNYLVSSPFWNNGSVIGAGAVTWGDGATGIKGVVSAANSLVGSKENDYIGMTTTYYGDARGITLLNNGNYVVTSPWWDNSTVENVGAITWGDGTTGVKGEVSSTNSLVGSTAQDEIGCVNDYMVGDCDVNGVIPLENGNYVVSSPYWDNEAAVNAGAATWGSGMNGVKGIVSVDNSLVGSITGDLVGRIDNFGKTYIGLTHLANGNYVVNSPRWNYGGASGTGAITWGNGNSGITGVISTDNSLVGTSFSSVIPLSNGSYVVSNPEWNNGAGVATWGSGTSGVKGIVSVDNSLMGTTDSYGNGFHVIPLSNGNYVVINSFWNNGTALEAGAVTWGNGNSGITGIITTDNSLVGSTAHDGVGSVDLLGNGNYVVSSPAWDDGAAVDVGAVTWGDGENGTLGPISTENSVRGNTSGGGSTLIYQYDDINNQLVVGRDKDNITTLFKLPQVLPPAHNLFLPITRR